MNALKWIFSEAKRFRRWLLGGSLILAALGASGCRTLSYYAQAAKGQYEILARQEPVERLLASEKIAPELRARLLLLREIRDYAERELKLPVNGHYRKYADLKRPFVVWNVEAAPEFSTEPKSWRYPIVGRLEYRGFFKENSARNYADLLQTKGYDVHISGAIAYSTLGWFKDPALNTFVFLPEGSFIETVFHELAHQRLFVSGDEDFNEAFATFVGREGVRRFLTAKDDQETLAGYEASNRHEDEFAQLVVQTRIRLAEWYGDERDRDGKVRAATKYKLPVLELAEGKRRLIGQMRLEYEALKQRWGGDTTYDLWFSRPINNAKLNSVAAYHEFVPGFARLLELSEGSLERFYAAAERLAKLRKSERRQWLRTSGADKSQTDK